MWCAYDVPCRRRASPLFFRRVIARRNEEDYVVYPPKKESGFVSLFPDLAGLEGIHPGRSIEVIPYFTSKAQFLRHRDPCVVGVVDIG